MLTLLLIILIILVIGLFMLIFSGLTLLSPILFIIGIIALIDYAVFKLLQKIFGNGKKG